MERSKPAGIWTGSEKGKPATGIGYTATCGKCGAQLYSLPSEEAATRHEFFWQVHPPVAKQHFQEKLEREALLSGLLASHAEYSQVTTSLGLGFTDYSASSPKREELPKWLFLDEVKEAAMRYPGIYFHMNALTMTWLFFDSDSHLQGYYVRSA